jgi:two-component system, NtrC family, sensor kinase
LLDLLSKIKQILHKIDSPTEKLLLLEYIDLVQSTWEHQQNRIYLLEQQRESAEKQIERTSSELADTVIELEEQRAGMENASKELVAQNKILEQSLGRIERIHNQILIQEKIAGIGQMVAGVAHEIKNPLNFVINFSEVTRDELHEMIGLIAAKLGNTQEDAEIKQLASHMEQKLAKVIDHGARIDGIIHRMLQYAGNNRGEKVPVDLEDLVKRCVDIVARSFRTNYNGFRANINIDVQNIIGEVWCIPQDMSRVLMNIINNALYSVYDKSKTGNNSDWIPILDIRVKNLRSMVEFIVEDNGVGIEEFNKTRVFTPFFTTKSQSEGTGLGLAIAYDIVVHGHSGFMQMEAKKDQFAKFIFHIPKNPDGSLPQNASEN